MKNIFAYICILFVLLSCKKNNEDVLTTNENTENYIYISHLRKSYNDTNSYTTIANPYMDKRIENLDYSKYKMLLLGGDLTILTSADNETISRVDSIFNLGKETTLWSLGNHDTADINRVQYFTHRPTFYTYYRNKVTFIVLNTQENGMDIINEQLQMINNVVDTIKNSKHLIVMHHVLLWMYANPDLEPLIDSISNIPWGTCEYCFRENNFYTDVYPKLLEVKNKGIDVICVAGDIGLKVKEFEYQTNEGIQFLASGMEADSLGNKVLIFKNNLETNKLDWSFIPLSNL